MKWIRWKRREWRVYLREGKRGCEDSEKKGGEESGMEIRMKWLRKSRKVTDSELARKERRRAEIGEKKPPKGRLKFRVPETGIGFEIRKRHPTRNQKAAIQPSDRLSKYPAAACKEPPSS